MAPILGVAWWLPTTRVAAESVAGSNWRRCVSLSRFVVAPGMPTNSASFLLGRSIRILRSEGRWDVLVTWADEAEGHMGGIYRATNWEYLGARPGGRRYRSPGGAIVSMKRGPRTFSHQEMIDMGCTWEPGSPRHKFRYVIREAT